MRYLTLPDVLNQLISQSIQSLASPWLLTCLCTSSQNVLTRRCLDRAVSTSPCTSFSSFVVFQSGQRLRLVYSMPQQLPMSLHSLMGLANDDSIGTTRRLCPHRRIREGTRPKSCATRHFMAPPTRGEYSIPIGFLPLIQLRFGGLYLTAAFSLGPNQSFPGETFD